MCLFDCVCIPRLALGLAKMGHKRRFLRKMAFGLGKSRFKIPLADVKCTQLKHESSLTQFPPFDPISPPRPNLTLGPCKQQKKQTNVYCSLPVCHKSANSMQPRALQSYPVRYHGTTMWVPSPGAVWAAPQSTSRESRNPRGGCVFSLERRIYRGAPQMVGPSGQIRSVTPPHGCAAAHTPWGVGRLACVPAVDQQPPGRRGRLGGKLSGQD